MELQAVKLTRPWPQRTLTINTANGAVYSIPDSLEKAAASLGVPSAQSALRAHCSVLATSGTQTGWGGSGREGAVSSEGS